MTEPWGWPAFILPSIELSPAYLIHVVQHKDLSMAFGEPPMTDANQPSEDRIHAPYADIRDHGSEVSNVHAQHRIMSKRLCSEEPLAGGVATWDEDTEVDEPGTAVELGVDSLDLEWVYGLLVSLDDLHDDDAGNLFWGLCRAPSG